MLILREHRVIVCNARADDPAAVFEHSLRLRVARDREERPEPDLELANTGIVRPADRREPGAVIDRSRAMFSAMRSPRIPCTCASSPCAVSVDPCSAPARDSNSAMAALARTSAVSRSPRRRAISARSCNARPAPRPSCVGVARNIDSASAMCTSPSSRRPIRAKTPPKFARITGKTSRSLARPRVGEQRCARTPQSSRRSRLDRRVPQRRFRAQSPSPDGAGLSRCGTPHRRG